ncbi:MAG TPA: hypothetical protein VII16_16000 [Actinomycetes bacterium]|jgi:hypothetical protein
MGQAPVVNVTDDLNQFEIGGRSIDPARMTAEQWLTNRRMAMVSVEALDHYGLANVAHYPIIDITNAALSRMLMGGTAPAGVAGGANADDGRDLLRGALGRAEEQWPAREPLPRPDHGGAHSGGRRVARGAGHLGVPEPALRHPGIVRGRSDSAAGTPVGPAPLAGPTSAAPLRLKDALSPLRAPSDRFRPSPTCSPRYPSTNGLALMSGAGRSSPPPTSTVV